MKLKNHQIVIQLPAVGTVDDFDHLVELEDALIQAFSQNNAAEVDGHDIGQGRMNIYLLPRVGRAVDPFDVVYWHLKKRGLLTTAVVVKHFTSSGKINVLWPKNFAGPFQF